MYDSEMISLCQIYLKIILNLKKNIFIKGAYNFINTYETEYYLTIVNIIFCLGFLDAKICYFLTKSFASEDIEYDWNHSKIILHYKSKLSSVNCENDEICCRTTCCSDSSVSKAEDIIMYVILTCINTFILYT